MRRFASDHVWKINEFLDITRYIIIYKNTIITIVIAPDPRKDKIPIRLFFFNPRRLEEYFSISPTMG